MAFVKWANYEMPFEMNNRADFAWFSNEDLGFIASLVTGTNDTEEYALPFASSIDLFEETTVLYRSDFMLGIEQIASVDDGDIVSALEMYMAMLQVEFATATFQGGFTDVEDEALKTKFAGPFGIGRDIVMVEGASIDQRDGQVGQSIVNVMQYMPFKSGIRLITPPYYTIVNKSWSFAATTGITAPATFSAFEAFAQRVWHRKSSLTPQERDFRNISIRFQLIDT